MSIFFIFKQLLITHHRISLTSFTRFRFRFCHQLFWSFWTFVLCHNTYLKVWPIPSNAFYKCPFPLFADGITDSISYLHRNYYNLDFLFWNQIAVEINVSFNFLLLFFFDFLTQCSVNGFKVITLFLVNLN